MPAPLDLWSLRVTPPGGSAETRSLAGWGATRAQLVRRNLAADELRLSIPVVDFAAAAAIDWLAEVELLDPAGAVFWRGTAMASPAEGRPDAHSRDLTCRGRWWWLERTPYFERWGAAFSGYNDALLDPDDPDEEGTFRPLQSHGTWQPRARTGLKDPFRTGSMGDEDARRSTGRLVGDVLEYAVGRGLPFAVGEVFAGRLVQGDREFRGASCAEVLRGAFRWHPGAALRFREAESGTVAEALEADELSAFDLDLDSGDYLTEALTLVQRPDLVPTCVGFCFTARLGVRGAGEAETIAWDLWPAGADPRQPGSLVQVVDAGNLDQSDVAADEAPRPGVPPVRQVFGAPAGGQAQRVFTATVDPTQLDWWRKRTPSIRGLDPALILVADGSWDVTADQPLPANWDPADPPPVPPVKAEVPRELVLGQIEDWMPWKHAQAEGEAVLIWTGDFNDPAAKKAFTGFWFDAGTGTFYRAVAVSARFTATNAPRRATFAGSGGTAPPPPTPAGAPASGYVAGPGGPPPARLPEGETPISSPPAPQPGLEPVLSAALETEEALVDNRISGGGTPASLIAELDGLARAIYEDRAAAAWQGSCTIRDTSAGDGSALPAFWPGSAVSVSGDAAAAGWIGLAVPVEQTTFSIDLGQLSATLGSTAHLSVQDWISLRRRQLDSRGSGGGRDAAERAAAARYNAAPLAADGAGSSSGGPERPGPTVGGLATANNGSATTAGTFDPTGNFPVLVTLNGRVFVGAGSATETLNDQGDQVSRPVTWGGGAWETAGRPWVEVAAGTTYSITRTTDEFGRLTQSPDVVAGTPSGTEHREPGTNGEDDLGQPGFYVAKFLELDADGAVVTGPDPGSWEPAQRAWSNIGSGVRIRKRGRGTDASPAEFRSLIPGSDTGSGTLVPVWFEELEDEVRAWVRVPGDPGSSTGTATATGTPGP